VAGVKPVTSSIGALQTTNEWGYLIDGHPDANSWKEQFLEWVIDVLHSPFDGEMQKKAAARFDWNRICEQWEKLIETGEFE